MTDYTIYKGDARFATKHVRANSVHLVFTSPPYWNIKEYSGKKEEIGYEQSLDEYLQGLIVVFAECYRILHPGCYMVINIGDQFVAATDDKPFHIIPLSSIILSMLWHADFSRIDWKQEKLDYIGTVRWKKVSTTKNSGGGSIMGSVDNPRDAHFLKNYEDIHFLKKPGSPPIPTQEQREKSRFTMDERKAWVKSDWSDIPPAKKSIGHQAPFPIALAERVIRLRSYWGETVYDPFMGTGSTVAAAFKTGRYGIGTELGWREDWEDIVKKRIDSVHKHATTVEEGL